MKCNRDPLQESRCGGIYCVNGGVFRDLDCLFNGVSFVEFKCVTCFKSEGYGNTTYSLSISTLEIHTLGIQRT